MSPYTHRLKSFEAEQQCQQDVLSNFIYPEMHIVQRVVQHWLIAVIDSSYIEKISKEFQFVRQWCKSIIRTKTTKKVREKLRFLRKIWKSTSVIYLVVWILNFYCSNPMSSIKLWKAMQKCEKNKEMIENDDFYFKYMASKI